MADFATEAELENLTGQTIDTARATILLSLASAAVRDAAGITIDQATTTDQVLDGPGGTELVLPEWPVTAVASIVEIDTDGTETTLRGPADDSPEYRWSRSGVVVRYGTWPCRPRSIKVTYTHGFSTVPDGIKRATLLAAARGLASPTGYASESIGDWSGSRSSEAGLALELTDREERLVHKALRQ